MAASTITFLGTGNAFHADGRGSQSLWFEPRNGGPFLVDVGPTSVAAMQRLRIDYGTVASVFVTHLHGDHTAGWPFLLLNLNFEIGRRDPLETHGPAGLRERLDGLMTHCYPEILADLAFPVHHREIAIAAASGLRAGPLPYDVIPMDHHPSSLGYRFHLGDSRVAVSGDTRWCAGLEELAGDSDLLIVECTSVHPHPHAHVSVDELRAGAERLGGCDVLLVHLTDEVAAELAADPIPRVTPCHDGMVWTCG